MRSETKSSYSSYPMRHLNGSKNGSHPGVMYPGERTDEPGGAVRKFLLFVYIIVSGVAAGALILLVIYGKNLKLEE